MLNQYVLTDQLTESNCYILEEKQHIIIIDPNDQNRILKMVKDKGFVVDYVILTHEHCDHMQGLNGVRNAWPKAKVIATKICSRNLGNKIKNMSGMMGTYLHFKYGGNKKYVYASIICNPADIEFDHTYELVWQSHHFSFHKVPGHTMGSCCITMDDDHLFSGDYLILNEDDVLRLPGGNQEAYEEIGRPWLRSLKKGIHVYPGHGVDYQLEKEI